MARRINKTVSSPLFNIQIYVDKAKERKARTLISKTPQILKVSYDRATNKFANQLLRIIKRAIRTGTPPPNSGVSWPPLKRVLQSSHHLYYLTGQYLRSVSVLKNKRTGNIFVGLPPKISKIGKWGPSGKTLNQIAVFLEYGTESIPPRPLWRAAWKSIGGQAKLRKVIKDEIRKELRKYT